MASVAAIAGTSPANIKGNSKRIDTDGYFVGFLQNHHFKTVEST